MKLWSIPSVVLGLLLAPVLATVLATGATIGAGDGTVASGLIAPASRKAAAAFTLQDDHGRKTVLSDYHGRVVVVDFWATWCTGCKVEIPWFMEFQRNYESSGLTTIGVAMDAEGWDKVKPYVEAHPFNYPVVVGSPALAVSYQLTALPVTVLLDRRGRVADVHAGMVDKDAWERQVQALLTEHIN